MSAYHENGELPEGYFGQWLEESSLDARAVLLSEGGGVDDGQTDASIGLLCEEEQNMEMTDQERRQLRNSSQTKRCCSPAVYVLTAAGVSSVGGVLFGYDVGIISGALLQLKKEFNLDCIEQELVVSSMLMGAILASLVGGFVVDAFGRKKTIILNSIVFIVGAIILALSPSYPVLIFGRLIVGFGVSLSVTAECVYISEISPADKRGMLVTLNEIGIVIGFLSAYLCNFLFIHVKNGWRYMLGISAIPAFIQCIGMCFLPSSPRYLMLKGREEQARDILTMMHGEQVATAEVESIKASLSEEREYCFIDLFKTHNNLRFRMFIAAGLIFLQQFTGQPNVLYYAPTLFQSIGFESDTAATLATVFLGLAKLASAIVAISLIDKVGRRKMLITGAIIMAISITALGMATFWIPSTNTTAPCSANVTSSAAKSISKRSIFVNYIITRDHFPGVSYVEDDDYISGSDSFMSESDNFYVDDFRDNDHSRVKRHSMIVIPEANATLLANITSGGDVMQGAPRVFRWCGVLSLVMYVVGYQISFGAGTWLIVTEIFPSAVKGRAISISTVLNWSTNLFVSLTFLDFIQIMGVSWTLLPYGFICLLSVVFIFLFIPETKGKSLEEVSELLAHSKMLQRCSCCRKAEESNGDVRQPYGRMHFNGDSVEPQY